MLSRFSASGRSFKFVLAVGQGRGSVLARRILLAMASASSVRLMRRHVAFVRLGHFLGAVAQAHHPRRRAGDHRLGQGKEIRRAEIIVEFLGDVARQFQMLLLVLAHRHMRRLVDQDVGGHQHRIGVKPDAGAFLVLAGFFLELGHAVHPAQPRHAIEDPGQLGMFRHLALVEDGRARGIDAGGDIGGGDFAGGAGPVPRGLP